MIKNLFKDAGVGRSRIRLTLIVYANKFQVSISENQNIKRLNLQVRSEMLSKTG